MSVHLITPPDNMSLSASRPHSPSQGPQGQSRTQKKPRSPLEISGECRARPANEDTAALVWELPVSQERWSYEAAHTRLCLLSLWHGKTTNTRDGKRARETRREGGKEGWDQSERLKDWWCEALQIKVTAQRQMPERKSRGREIRGQSAGLQNKISLIFWGLMLILGSKIFIYWPKYTSIKPECHSVKCTDPPRPNRSLKFPKCVGFFKKIHESFPGKSVKITNTTKCVYLEVRNETKCKCTCILHCI